MRPAVQDNRVAARDEVQYSARGFGPDARPIELIIANISALGLMARCTGPFKPGDRLRLKLPVIGVIALEVRWADDGRIGCQLDQPIAPGDYYALLAAMTAGT
ncbi:MAG: PilZ domain-containing protein [Sphingomonas sp.]